MPTTSSAPSTMVPPPAARPDVLPTARLNARAIPVREVRDELRRIPDARNAVTVAFALVQTFGVVIAAGVIGTWWAWLAAFVLMGRGHALLNILGHEGTHRLLFTNRTINDAVGRVLAYPTLQPFGTYRRLHMAHHRDELGPDEPDMDLYRGYPIPRDSWHRKLRRDALGITASKNLRSLVRAARSGSREARHIAIVQAGLLAASILAGAPMAYVVWLGSWATLWKVSNRLRSIAEHGGMVRSDDKRATTHVVRQGLMARFWMVPYHTGWHLAHHVDMGVPWRNLPRLHRELVDSGWVPDVLEHPTYRAFWRAASSGAPRPAPRPAVTS